jgi:hypothetical protein
VIRWVLAFVPILCAAQSVSMEGGAFHVDGWQPGPEPAAGWSSVFAVYAGSGNLPPLAGAYSIEHGSLTFRPRYPLAPGLHVRAVFQASEFPFDLPAALTPTSTTRVAHVYPSAAVLPENQLKLYLCFSAPMQTGEAWSRIHLLDSAGKPVELPFLEIDQELWNPDHTRLTVLFDPGRIKRGLLPLREMGPAIVEGSRYTLAIDREWLDASGAPLAEPFTKTFTAGPADREPVDPARWSIAAPRAGTVEPLVVRFPEPLDYAMLQHAITVDGVRGRVATGAGETEWRFTPDRPWQNSGYRLVIETNLEDLAGNRVGRAFDVDLSVPLTRKITTETVSLGFKPR